MSPVNENPLQGSKSPTESVLVHGVVDRRAAYGVAEPTRVPSR